MILEKLQSVVDGQPWYGKAVMDVLLEIPERIGSERIGDAHTIKELLLHMIAWTEEVQARLEGNGSGVPVRGDWPEASQYSWDELLSMFRKAHQQVTAVIRELPEDSLDDSVLEGANGDGGQPLSPAALVDGLVQHHIYHLGQIAILKKQLSTY